MISHNLLLTSLTILLLTGSQALAQSNGTLVICLNRSTQVLNIRTRCASTEVIVSGKNLTTATTAKPTATPTASPTGSSINLNSCYQTSAKRSASAFDGRIAVGLLCKQKSDLLLNDQFKSSDSTGARPVLESRRLVMNGKTPNGVEYGLIASGGNNKFYEVQVGAVCCPTTTSK